MASLPLTVEDLITDRGKVKLDFAVSCANLDRAGVSTGAPIVVQTGPTSFVSLPSVVGENRGNDDTLVGAFGLRYGLSKKAEIYARLSALTSQHRSSGVEGETTRGEAGFVDAWAGINYQFIQEGDVPGP